MGRLSCPFVTVFTTIVFITSVEDKPRTEASRDCANPEPSFEQSVKEMVGVGSDRTKGEKNVSIGNVVVATIFEEFETRLSRLERRLRAIEQPGKRGLFFFFFFYLHSSDQSCTFLFLYVESGNGDANGLFSLADELRRGRLGDLRRRAV